MESAKNCQICKDTVFKYICPNCKIPFCSVKCYKNPIHKHCSEKFYRNWVNEEIAIQSGSNSFFDKDEMYRILQRFEKNFTNSPPIDIGEKKSELDSDDEMDENELPDLSTRLKGINLDDADAVWSRLTYTEKTDFRSVVQKGNVSQTITLFTPWWTIQTKHKLIENIYENFKSDRSQEIFCNPEVLKKIEPIHTLIKKEPSSCIIYNLTNILGAYTCTVRFFNGDHASSTYDAFSYLMTLSATLRKHVNFNNEKEAIKSIIVEAQSTGLLTYTEEYFSIHQDVQEILNGPFKRMNDTTYILAALSDIHRLFTATKLHRKVQINLRKPTFSKTSADLQNDTLNYVSSARCNHLIKKIEFFLSYVKSKKY